MLALHVMNKQQCVDAARMQSGCCCCGVHHAQVSCCPHRYVKTYQTVKTSANGKTHIRRPKIQRLVTPVTLQRKRKRVAIKKARHEKVSTFCRHIACAGWACMTAPAVRQNDRKLHVQCLCSLLTFESKWLDKLCTLAIPLSQASYNIETHENK